MIRSVAVVLLLATGGVASGQTADVIREVEDLLNKLRPPKVNPFGGVMQQRAGVAVPQPPAGVQPLVEPVSPIRPTPRRIRISGPTPGGPLQFDRHGDPLPAGAIARFGTVRLRHGAEPAALTFSPDGKWLGSLSATEDGIRLWDVVTGKEVARLNAPITCAAFTRDGRVVVADDSRGKVWHPATNAIREFPDGTIPEGTTALAVHPDSRSFVAASPSKIVLIDIQTGKPRHEFKTPGGSPPNRVGYSSDGRWLAATGQKTGVWLWELRTGKRVRTYPPGETDVCEFAFSPDGGRIAIATNVVRVYPTDAEEELDGYTAPEEQLANPSFSADGKSVFGQLPDGAVRRIDAATGEVKDSWESPDGENKRPPVALSRDATFAAATDQSGGIRVWEPKTGKGPEVERLTMLYDSGLSADGKTASCLDSLSRVHVFDPLTGAPGKTILLPIGPDVPVSWDARTRRAAAVINNEESEIQIIDGDTGKVTCKFAAPANTGLPTVAFCRADRHRVAVFSPGTVAVVHAVSGRTLRTLNIGMHQNPARGCFSPDGRLLATTEGTLRVWEISTGKKRFEVELPNPQDVVFSSDGRLLAVWDNTDTVVIFDLRTGVAVRRFQLPGADGSLSCAAFTPDGKRLVTGSQDGVIVVWDVATADALLVLDRHEGQVTGFSFTADGARLLSTSADGTTLFWDLSAKPQPKPNQAVGGFEDAFRLLGSADAVHAQRGMEFYYRRPADAVKQFAERVPVPTAAPAERIAKYVRDLDSDDFQTRTTAAKELETIGGEASAALRTAAETSPSAEVRRTAGELVGKVEAAATRPEDLRVRRVVEVVEHLGTPEARELLKAWAAGPVGHRLTVEALAAVGRLK